MSSVLITGANRGLGLEFTRQYLNDGWEVHAFCRQPDKAAELSAMVAESRGNIQLREMDIGNKEQIEAAAKELKGLPIDLLINNAGIADGYGRGVYEMKEDPDIQNYDFTFWEEMMRINTLAPAKIIGAFLENIRAGGQKKIASLSSGLGSITNLAWAGKYGYCASKAGLNMVSKGLAEWLRPENIMVISLSPGWTRTAMGGPHATNSAEESVSGMRHVISGLTLAETGRFWNFDGEELPW
ncbi:SDR family oxidoreductase [Rhodospirillales bacterium]|nr:SDR family oxidoreductase [Rhodospirillales bacterium]